MSMSSTNNRTSGRKRARRPQPNVVINGIDVTPQVTNIVRSMMPAVVEETENAFAISECTDERKKVLYASFLLRGKAL